MLLLRRAAYLVAHDGGGESHPTGALAGGVDRTGGHPGDVLQDLWGCSQGTSSANSVCVAGGLCVCCA